MYVHFLLKHEPSIILLCMCVYKKIYIYHTCPNRSAVSDCKGLRVSKNFNNKALSSGTYNSGIGIYM